MKFRGLKQPAVRHLRIGFTTPLLIETVLVHGRGIEFAPTVHAIHRGLTFLG